MDSNDIGKAEDLSEHFATDGTWNHQRFYQEACVALKSEHKAPRGAAESISTTSPCQTFRNLCPICTTSAAEPMLKVSNTPLQQADVQMSRCPHRDTGYFTDEQPVLSYDNEDFEPDYRYNYVQNDAGITAMLERLAGDEDPRVASGALYRSFKDCVNLGRLDDARRIYPLFAELVKQIYGIDFEHPDAAPANYRSPEDAFDYGRFPAWTGSAFYYVGKYEKLNDASMDRQDKLFTAATREMAREIEQSKQFAGEAAHFLPMARMEVARLQSARHADQHGTPTDQLPAYIQREVGPLAGRDVCLLAIYAPDGKVSAATGRYIECLHAAGFTTIACLAVNDIAAPVDMTNLNAAKGVFVRKNGGMDFAMWAAVLRCHPDAWNATRLVFTNDSVLVLPDLFPAFATDLRAVETPVVGLTEGLKPQHHFQSYFFMLQGEALRHPRIQEFWSSVRVIEDKWELIKTYEVKLLEIFYERFQLPVTVLYSFDRLFPGGDVEVLRRHNLSLSCWEYLIRIGMPFVKAELIRVNPLDMAIEHWRVLAAENGANVADIEAHIGVPRQTLAKTGKKKRSKKRHRLLAALGLRRH